MKTKPIAINVDLFNKPTKQDFQKYHNQFLSGEIYASDLLTFCSQGFSFCSQYEKERKAENFKQTGFVCLDFDKWNLDEALKHPFIKQNASFIYTTCSHNEKQHRFRAVFELEQPITKPEKYKQLMKGLLKKFPDDDSAVTNPVFMAAGNDKAKTYQFFNILDRNMMLHLMAEGTIKPKPVDPKLLEYIKNREEKNITVDEARKLLNQIPKMPGYEAWRNICWAVANEFGSKGKFLIQEWSPDYKNNGRDIERLFKTADGRITIGTLYYYAKH